MIFQLKKFSNVKTMYDVTKKCYLQYYVQENMFSCILYHFSSLNQDLLCHINHWKSSITLVAANDMEKNCSHNPWCDFAIYICNAYIGSRITLIFLPVVLHYGILWSHFILSISLKNAEKSYFIEMFEIKCVP